MVFMADMVFIQISVLSVRPKTSLSFKTKLLVIPNLEFAFAGWKVIVVLNMYQNALLTFVSKLILLEWPIVCLQEVREFSLFDIIIKSVFMLSRIHKRSHDLKV
jgi:hypothetical protein